MVWAPILQCTLIPAQFWGATDWKVGGEGLGLGLCLLTAPSNLPSPPSQCEKGSEVNRGQTLVRPLAPCSGFPNVYLLAQPTLTSRFHICGLSPWVAFSRKHSLSY